MLKEQSKVPVAVWMPSKLKVRAERDAEWLGFANLSDIACHALTLFIVQRTRE